MTRILVVEDDAKFRRILIHVLKLNGFEPLEAQDGVEAIELAAREQPHLILMDVMMRRMTGVDAVRRLRSDPATRDIPVIMCTARDARDEVLEAIQAGATDYIVKPSRHEVYLEKIRRALATRRATPPGPERRRAPRVRVDWSAVWSIPGPHGAPLHFKSDVRDASPEGVGLEFDRCATCTGYQEGDVHPACLLAPWALRLPTGRPVKLTLVISPKQTLALEGRIAHVYQDDDRPGSETVGIAFTALSPEARDLLTRLTR
jgi:CheY-like chemotaxis protein